MPALRSANGSPEVSAGVELPTGDAIFLDHLAHWVGDIHAAYALLRRIGFIVTPYAEHVHATTPGGPAAPAGSANHCVMLEAGYLEVLTPIGDTPVAREVRAALDRYTGLHLAAFCVEDAVSHRERLVSAGFAQREAVSLTRDTTTADGDTRTLRFTVVRPEVGCLPEGRVQFLTHHTPDTLWQPRWLAHPNTARGLTDMLFCVDDACEAGERYQRYLGRGAEPIDGGCVLGMERGRLTLLDARGVEAALPGIEIPHVPFMAAYAVECAEPRRARAVLDASGIDYSERDGGVLTVPLAPALGGTMVLMESAALPPWLSSSGSR
jgi:hypothetical protein